MRHPLLWLEWAAWTLAASGAWWLLDKLACALGRLEARRRHRRNARRLADWKPPRHRHDPGDDVTHVMPGIQRPKGP